MKYQFSRLFHRQGYIPVSEYAEDIEAMKKEGSWKLPLSFGDRLHFTLLKIFIQFSWFKKILFVEHTHVFSPAYVTLVKFLKKKNIFDKIYERNLHYPGIHSFYIEKSIKVGNSVFPVSGQGVSEDVSTAFSIALGEIVERTISGLFDANKNLVEGSYEQIRITDRDVIYPPLFHRFLDIQKSKFKKINVDSKKIIKWVQGKNLITGKAAFIPQQMTSWFRRMFTDESLFVHTTTNGAAGYFTREGATLRGLLEVVQRDGFLVHWLTMTTPNIITHESLPENLRKKIRQLVDFGLSIYIADVTSLDIPTVIIAAINTNSEMPQIVLGGGSDLTFEKAIESSIKEIYIASEMFYFKESKQEFEAANQEIEPFISSLNKITRQLYWRGRERVKAFDWFISGAHVQYEEIIKRNLLSNSCSDESKLHTCLSVLKSFGEEYYPTVYFPQNPIQEKLGFYIAQVFIPKAFPLYLFEGYGTFDSDRLCEFAVSRGKLEWKLNPYPHMFS